MPANPHELVVIPWNEIAHQRRAQPLIDGLIDREGFSVLYGPSGSGKTFLALDIAARVAIGRPWHGKTVHRGAVAYVAAEGRLGIGDRLQAIRRHYNVRDDDGHLMLVPESLDLRTSAADVGRLLAALSPRLVGVKLELVIIDTLAHAMAGGDENSSSDMGAVIRSCYLLRNTAECHVMLIHHTGKDERRGARGHSSLRAAVDTEMEVEGRDNWITLKVTKQRDHELGSRFSFHTTPITVVGNNGLVHSSRVLVPTREIPARNSAEPTGQQLAALLLLTAMMDAEGQNSPSDPDVSAGARCVKIQSWRRRCYEGGLSTSANPEAQRKAFDRAKDKLFERGLVGISGDWVWIKATVQRDNAETSPEQVPSGQSPPGQDRTSPHGGVPVCPESPTAERSETELEPV